MSSTTTAAHLSSKSDNWPTPQAFFDALNAEFGFVLDVCASTTNHKAGSFYALDHPEVSRRDGLAADWAGDAAQLDGAVWMNPPYGRPIAAWMAKAHTAARAGATVVTLVPVRADTGWWHEHVLATGAEVRYVRGRLTFGDAVNTAAFASAVVIYRPTDVAGQPGPVTTMPARPTPAAAPPQPAAAGKAAPARASQQHLHPTSRLRLDCITCRWHSRAVIEHLFDSGSGEAPTPTVHHLSEGAVVASPTTTVSRLDELTTRLVAIVHERADTAAELAGSDPTACLELVRATVARRGGIGRTYKREAAVQHLFSTVWQYGRFFAPGPDWCLVEAEPGAARLRWRHRDLQVGDVVDVVSASGHPDVAALSRPDGVTVRLCNVANRPASLLWLPGHPAPQRWAQSLDPVACSQMAVAA